LVFTILWVIEADVKGHNLQCLCGQKGTEAEAKTKSQHKADLVPMGNFLDHGSFLRYSATR
jgi:hypothetical protein